jgi:hypothetical protein
VLPHNLLSAVLIRGPSRRLGSLRSLRRSGLTLRLFLGALGRSRPPAAARFIALVGGCSLLVAAPLSLV